nr:unnamed protein product [Digitaria exilis]
MDLHNLLHMFSLIKCSPPSCLSPSPNHQQVIHSFSNIQFNPNPKIRAIFPIFKYPQFSHSLISQPLKYHSFNHNCLVPKDNQHILQLLLQLISNLPLPLLRQ